MIIGVHTSRAVVHPANTCMETRLYNIYILHLQVVIVITMQTPVYSMRPVKCLSVLIVTPTHMEIDVSSVWRDIIIF